MTTPEPDPPEAGRSASPDARHLSAAERQHRARLIAAAVIGAAVTAFALLNLGDVKVHWLIATGQTPLILVIVLAFLLGMIADRMLILRGRRRRSGS